MQNFEQEEINLLKNEGFPIKAKLFGKVREWRTKRMSLSRLVDLSDVYLKMQVDEKGLYSENVGEVLSAQYKSVKSNAKNIAKALAIAVSDWKITRVALTWLFLKSITPDELSDYAQKLIKQSDYQNFTLSIVLMNGNRITKPEAIENKG